MSCHVLMSCQVISRLLTSCHVMSCHVMSCHVMSCHVLSCHVMSCHVMSSHVFSRLVTSCHIMSCHVTSSCSRILLPKLSSEPSKFFYYGGGVATTRFSKPWPCAGIRLGATLSLWRRLHCDRGRRGGWCDLGSVLRGRLRGSGVLEVCRGCAAGVPRRCAVGIGFRARFVHAWPTCVSCGRLRGSCVLGDMSRACRGCAAGVLAAPCRGDWVRGVSRARMILRAVTCVSRGRCWTSDALTRSGKHWTVDPRGRWGETCIWTLLRVRFTWQVWGKAATGGVANVDSRGRRGEARAASVSRGRREWCDRWPRWASLCVAGAGNRAW